MNAGDIMRKTWNIVMKLISNMKINTIKKVSEVIINKEDIKEVSP